jgi:hypothetical protein
MLGRADAVVEVVTGMPPADGDFASLGDLVPIGVGSDGPGSTQ